MIDNKIGQIGIVDFVNNQSAQKLIKIIGTQNKEFFIPFHEEFIVNIDTEDNILTVNIPEELININ